MHTQALVGSLLSKKPDAKSHSNCPDKSFDIPPELSASAADSRFATAKQLNSLLAECHPWNNQDRDAADLSQALLKFPVQWPIARFLWPSLLPSKADLRIML